MQEAADQCFTLTLTFLCLFLFLPLSIKKKFKKEILKDEDRIFLPLYPSIKHSDQSMIDVQSMFVEYNITQN